MVLLPNIAPGYVTPAAAAVNIENARVLAEASTNPAIDTTLVASPEKYPTVNAVPKPAALVNGSPLIVVVDPVPMTLVRT